MSGAFYMPVSSVGLTIGGRVMGARILMNRYPFRCLLSVHACLLFKLKDDNSVVILEQKYRKLRLAVWNIWNQTIFALICRKHLCRYRLLPYLRMWQCLQSGIKPFGRLPDWFNQICYGKKSDEEIFIWCICRRLCGVLFGCREKISRRLTAVYAAPRPNRLPVRVNGRLCMGSGNESLDQWGFLLGNNWKQPNPCAWVSAVEYRGLFCKGIRPSENLKEAAVC